MPESAVPPPSRRRYLAWMTHFNGTEFESP